MQAQVPQRFRCVKFTLFRDAKSLVKHLLVLDLSKRYGNLKNGVNDIKKHRFLNSINLGNLLAKKVPPFFKPNTNNKEDDVSNFGSFEDSLNEGS